MISRESVSYPGTAGSGPQAAQRSPICGDIIHLCMICEVKIARTSFLLEEVKASPKPEELLPIRSMLSFPALGTFLVSKELHCSVLVYTSI